MAKLNFVSLTPRDVQNLKAMIRTGEPVYRIAKRMAPQYNRTVSSFTVTLYKLAKQTRKIAEWNGPKRVHMTSSTPRRTFEIATEGIDKRVRVEKYADHVRVYF